MLNRLLAIGSAIPYPRVEAEAGSVEALEYRLRELQRYKADILLFHALVNRIGDGRGEEALEWAERWVKVRTAQNWGPTPKLYFFGRDF